jgi:UDP-glucose 4-epimerase
VKILVTGGEGFIGKHFCTMAYIRGHKIETYDKHRGQDVLDKPELEEAVRRNDAVVHLAGRLGTTETFDAMERTLNVNIKGAVNVFEAALAGDKRVVYLATKQCDWYNPYLISKRCSAELALMYAQYKGLRINVVRAMNVYGPGQHWGKINKAVPTFIVNAIQGKDLIVYGDGKQLVDLIHVYDIADILMILLMSDYKGLSVEAGTGQPTTVLAMAEMIRDLVGSKSCIKFVPMRIGEPPHSTTIADTKVLNGTLEYWPLVDLEEGMAGTVDWYKEHYLEVQDA